MSEAMPQEAQIWRHPSGTDQPTLGEHLVGPGTVGAISE